MTADQLTDLAGDEIRRIGEGLKEKLNALSDEDAYACLMMAQAVALGQLQRIWLDKLGAENRAEIVKIERAIANTRRLVLA